MDSRKRKALNKFVKKIRKKLDNKIWGIYLFGSTAKGTDSPESDIDVLIIYFNAELKEITGVIDETSFEIACEFGKIIEPVLMSEQEYKESLGRSPFLWEVIQFGKPIFVREAATEWELDFKDYLELAKEYISYAEDALAENKLRLTIDTAYNAAELLVKALIISTKNSLASSHGGIVNQFGKLFILTNQIESQIGKELHRALRLRAHARYKPKTQISQEDAEFIITLSKKLLKITQEHLKPTEK
ncbi:MAG: HEPN domain-containing protein [Candidatus Aminicenantia bacterium]